VRYAHCAVEESQNRKPDQILTYLNRAVAIAMRDGPEAGLRHIDALLEQGNLANYYLAHSALADMYRRLGRTAEARPLMRKLSH